MCTKENKRCTFLPHSLQILTIVPPFTFISAPRFVCPALPVSFMSHWQLCSHLPSGGTYIGLALVPLSWTRFALVLYILSSNPLYQALAFPSPGLCQLLGTPKPQQPKRHLVHQTPRRPRRPRWRISGKADSWLKEPKQVPREAQRGADLWLVGYSSTVITSSAFQAAMLVPQNRHCQPIIADSLLPKNRKKQQTAEISMEPPAQGDQRRKKHEIQVRQHLQKQVHLHTQSPQLGPPHGTPAMELEPSAWVMSPE